MKEYDCFRKQKDAALTSSLPAISLVVQYVTDFYNLHNKRDETAVTQLQEFFYKLLRVRNPIPELSSDL